MKRLLTVLLALSLGCACCACAAVSSPEDTPTAPSETFISGALQGETQKQPQEQTPAEPEEEAPAQEQTGEKMQALKDRFTATWTVDETPQTEAQQFSNEAGTSIDVLREEIANAGARFGVCHIGYFEYFEETGIDFGQWYEGAASPFAAYYPFFSEIDASHTIGEGGYLYCILGGAYDDAIAVTDRDGQTLYSASNGDPILLFCDRGGDGSAADLTVTITAADGTVCTYAPTLDELGYPQLLVGDERQLLSWIIEAAEEAAVSFDALLAEGWLGTTVYGLAGGDGFDAMSWDTAIWDEEKGTMVNFSLSFFANPAPSGAYDGEVLLQCFYEGVNGAQAEWEGWCRFETELDQPSRLQLDLMLMRGDDMEHYEASSYISEAFWSMIHPNGEVLLLIPEARASALPFMAEGVPGVELICSMG